MNVLKIKKSSFEKIILEASKTIESGGVIVAPTDTVYGMICNAKNKKVVKELFQIKKRPEEKGMPIFAKDIAAAKKLSFISSWQEKILQKYWPGGLTAVLKRKRGLPQILFGKEKGIALRVPDNKFILAVLKKTRLPLTGTSANISGMPASTKIKEVLTQFKDKKYKPDLVIDAGNLKKGLPSTIVDLRSKKIKILRQGEVRIESVDFLSRKNGNISRHSH